MTESIATQTLTEWRIIPSLLSLLAVVSVFLALVFWLQDPETLPIRHVRVEGNVHYIDKSALEQSIEPYVTGGFFTINVTKVHEVLSANPWIKRLSVRRIWPDRLLIHVTEREPIVRWNAEELMDEEAVIFRPESLEAFKNLPILEGGENQQEELLAEWETVKNSLKNIKLEVKRLSINSRNAIDAELDNGILLRLGKTDQHSRLQRFVEMFPLIEKRSPHPIRYVDLRYTNGLAIGS